MATGYLVVQTYLSRESYGVQDVRVELSSGKTLYTDENGFTEKIEINAPPREESEQPGNPGDATPYTAVDITLAKEGYFTIIIRNVQIFAGETTLQPVQMLPLPENGGGGTIEYDLLPQNL
ncbi:MAG: hypothetical protein IKJ06_04400 [Clostridia bacterium]|nr:hypothetical protein [Clostridia bacterium]